MIDITPSISIEENEIQETFIRASGPGCQNFKMVSTGVQLHFEVRNSPSLPQDVRERLLCLGGKRITKDGVLVIEATRFRTQWDNRQDAIDRLVGLIARAARPPRKRIRTRPSRASKRRRLENKRRRSEVKRLRRVHRHVED
jgi:ribosome-associated protein